MSRLLLVILATAAAGGCARDPLDTPCPAAHPGDLAVSEIRGRQSSSSDAFGQWIEIYNTTGAAIRLTGLAVELTTLTLSDVTRFEVHDEAAQIAPASYFVLGRFTASTKPAYVDYPFGDTFSGDLPAGAGLDLVACGTVVDHIVYRALPFTGTWGFDGARTPDAAANDTESLWCVDSTPNGTPRTGNKACAH
jgi:hypothetical protein